MQDKLYIYHPNGQATKTPDNFPVFIFGSSSRGNATYLPELNTIIDFGMPYKTYLEHDEDFFYNVQYVLLTHQHTDHLNLATVHKVLQLYPHVKFIASPYVLDYIRQQDLNWDVLEYVDRFIELPVKAVDENTKLMLYHAFRITLPDGLTMTIQPVATHHEDIVNTAYYIYWKTVEDLEGFGMEEHEHRLMYASDLDNTDQLLSLQGSHRLDYCFLEANHDPAMVNMELVNDGDHRFEAKGCLRHLGEPEAWDYVTKNVKSNGYFVPLHASKRFSSLMQDLTDE